MKRNLLFSLLIAILYVGCVPCKLVILETADRLIRTRMDSLVVRSVSLDSVQFAAYDSEPELIGGYKFIQKNLKYPEKARRNCICGSALIQVVVDETGRVVDSKIVVEDEGWGFGEAAIKVLKTSKWVPAKKGGEPQKVRITIPVKFRLK